MEVLTYISCMDTAYGYGNPHPQTLHFRYRTKFLVINWLMNLMK